MEIWKDVVGFEGLYQVNTKGDVKSLSGVGISNKKEKILKPRINKDGYLSVSLSKDCKIKTFYTHRIVAIAFIQNPKGKRTVNHINGVKNDNRVENLEWNTYKENINHSYHERLSFIGENRSNSKLTEIQAKEIKYLNPLVSNREMGLIYKVSSSVVSRIRNGKIWKHV